MTAKVHASAVLEGDVELGDGVVVGPQCHLAGRIRVGPGSHLDSGVHLVGAVTLGRECVLLRGCSIGGPAQNTDLSPRAPVRSAVLIGSRNVIREGVTIHRGATPGSRTTVGDDCYLMVGVHVAHDVRLDSRIVIVNGTQLAGESKVHDDAYIAGMVGVATGVRIGRGAFVTGQSGVDADVLPFCRYSRRGYMRGVMGERLTAAGFGRSDVDWYEELLERSATGTSWERLFSAMDATPGTLQAVIREFLRTTRCGVGPVRSVRAGRG